MKQEIQFIGFAYDSMGGCCCIAVCGEQANAAVQVVAVQVVVVAVVFVLQNLNSAQTSKEVIKSSRTEGLTPRQLFLQTFMGIHQSLRF